MAAWLLTAALWAQRAVTVRGQVLDPSGAVVVGAVVSVGAPGGVARQTASGDQGRFAVPEPAQAEVRITVTAGGFAPTTIEHVRVKPGMAPVIVHLHLAAGEQSVTVSASAATVGLSPEDRAATVNVSGRSLQALPDDPDQLATDLQALAGPAVGGGSADVYVDGFTRGDIPPKSAISSIQINDDPFSAQFDHIGYGRIQIETKPGSQALHGHLAFDGNRAGFNSLNPYLSSAGAAPPQYDSQIWSASLGGPAGRHASWFLAAERRTIHDANVINAEVLSPTLTPQTLVTTTPNPHFRTAIAPRLDLQLGSQHVLTLRYEWLKSTDLNDGSGGQTLASQAVNQHSRHQNLQVGDTQLLSPRTVNRVRFQFLHIDENNAAQVMQPTLEVLGAFSGGGSSLVSYQRAEVHNQLRDDLSLTRGTHQIEIGGESFDLSRTEDNRGNFNGTFVFPSLSVYQATLAGLRQGLTMAQLQAAGTGPSQFTLAGGTSVAHVNRLTAALYAQDNWHATPRLELAAGLRWESQSGMADHSDWAPRLSLAWGVGRGQTPATVLRAAAGVFYERLDDDQMIIVASHDGHHVQSDQIAAPEFYPDAPPLSTLSGLAASFPTTYRFSPNLHAPYMIDTSAEVDRQLGTNSSVTLNVLHSRGHDQLFTNDINAPLPGTYDPANPASGTRPLGNAAGYVYEFQSGGTFSETDIRLTYKLRAGKRMSLMGYYGVTAGRHNTNGPASFPLEPWNLNADEGPYGGQRVVFSGNFELPWGIEATPYFLAWTRPRFSVTLGEDLFGTGQQNGRPALVSTATPPQDVVNTEYGPFDVHPSADSAFVPPNSEHGPAPSTLNLRLSKNFGLGRRAAGSEPHYQMRIGVAARNLLNQVNRALPVGNLNSPRFGQSIGLIGGPFSNGAANRRLDAQLSFDF